VGLSSASGTQGNGEETGEPDLSDPCVFEDPLLAEAVRAEIRQETGVNPGVEVTEYEASVVHELYLNDAGVSSLEGIQCLTLLYQLRGDGNSIKDLGPLADHPSLNSIYLGSNQIQSLAGLSNLPQLRTLSLDDNPVTEFNELGPLPALEHLSLRGGSVATFEGLPELPALDTLDLTGNPIHSLSELHTLPALQTLYLGDSELEDLVFPEVQPLLWFLFARNASIHTLQGFTPEQLPSLHTLLLDSNPLGSAEGLETFSNLGNLGLAYTGIDDLSPLAELDALETFYGAGNGLTDITPVVGATELGLAENQITTLAPLASGPPLEMLDISDNLLTDINEFSLIDFQPCATAWVSGNDGINVQALILGLCDRGVIAEESCNLEECYGK
jgi:internalin A